MSIDADIDVQAVFPHLTYFSTNVCKLLMFLSTLCSPTSTNVTAKKKLVQFHLIKEERSRNSQLEATETETQVFAVQTVSIDGLKS